MEIRVRLTFLIICGGLFLGAAAWLGLALAPPSDEAWRTALPVAAEAVPASPMAQDLFVPRSFGPGPEEFTVDLPPGEYVFLASDTAPVEGGSVTVTRATAPPLVEMGWEPNPTAESFSGGGVPGTGGGFAGGPVTITTTGSGRLTLVSTLVAADLVDGSAETSMSGRVSSGFPYEFLRTSASSTDRLQVTWASSGDPVVLDFYDGEFHLLGHAEGTAGEVILRVGGAQTVLFTAESEGPTFLTLRARFVEFWVLPLAAVVVSGVATAVAYWGWSSRRTRFPVPWTEPGPGSP